MTHSAEWRQALGGACRTRRMLVFVMVKRPLHPAVALLLIAPVLGELVSGHQSPATFFNPVAFLVFALPYGCGALLCREFARRWGTGWKGLGLLGVAYALYEEGIVSRALFNPSWHELPALAGFDNVGGVNLAYGMVLVHFHVTISIAASVTIAEVLYPTRRLERWLPDRYVVACAIVLMLWAPVLEFLARGEQPLYRPPLSLWLGTAVGIGALIVAARFVRPCDASERRAVASPLRFFIVGAINTSTIFSIVLIAPDVGLQFPLLASLPTIIAVETATLALIARWSGYGVVWGDQHRLALVAGWLAFFLIVNAMADLEQFQGRLLVSGAAVFALAQLWRRVTTR